MKTLEEMLTELAELSKNYESCGYPAFMMYFSDSACHTCFRNPLAPMPHGSGSTPNEACQDLITNLERIRKGEK